MEADDLCLRLPWDSDFFGLNIARLTLTRLSPELASEALTWCRSNNIDCLYFLADARDSATVRLAEDNSFRLVDIRLTLDMHLAGEGERMPNQSGTPHREDATGTALIRPHRPADIPSLRAIAASGHHDSRFYYDPNFPNVRCDALYETWIEKSCNGYADMVFVAELRGQAEGYVSCHLPSEREGQIGLVGIAAHAQGRGLGQKLVNEALKWFHEQGVGHVTVVTQGRNASAQRLYQRCGFVTREVQLWYHRWFQRRNGIIE
jgi:dTDP-4-amino-4,6-dideoxy-D-galactose acyltransferase